MSAAAAKEGSLGPADATEMLGAMMNFSSWNRLATVANSATPENRPVFNILTPVRVLPATESSSGARMQLPAKRHSEESSNPSAGACSNISGCSTIPSKRPERMKDWLIRQIESGEHPGLEWENKDHGVFRIPWRHAKHRDYDPNTDASIFRAWAIQSGRYHGEGDQASWKANFRSAICSLPDVQELPGTRTDKYRVFQIISENNRHHLMTPKGSISCTPITASANLCNSASSSKRPRFSSHSEEEGGENHISLVPSTFATTYTGSPPSTGETH